MALIGVLLALSGRAAEAATAAQEHGRAAESPAPRDFVLGLSPYLDKSVKDEVYRAMVRLVVSDLPLNSTLRVYDAFELKSITQVTVPDLRAFMSAKTRANQFASAIGSVRQFLAQEPARPKQGHLDFRDTIRLPQFCDFLADNLAGKEGPLTVLLLGSPLYQDAKEPSFSMVDGYFPSDGHLMVSREKSVFGVSQPAGSVRPLVVHWVYFGDPWISELHKDRVERFWSLYLDKRSAQLASFTGDLPTGLEAFRGNTGGSVAQAKGWSIDQGQTKVEMVRIGRSVEVADWLMGDANALTGQHAPSVMVGPMKIGIRWKDNIDLDLYATPHPGAETLFFQHVRSPEGYYYKDHRSSPGKEFEFIEFESPVDAREVEAFVNFYKGDCPGGPRGEVRIEFDGRIYGAPFSIRSSDGNRGRSGPQQQEFWTRIPVQTILKLPSAG